MTTRRVLAAVLFVFLSAPTARAAGVAVRWDACFGDGGVINHNFACNTNNGVENLLATFVLPAPLAEVSGSIATFEVASAAATVPAWWQLFNAGACRQNNLITNEIPPLGASVCTSWDGLAGVIAIGSFTIGLPAANDITIVVPLAVAQTDSLAAGQEYITTHFAILHGKTVGFGSCGGCSIAACIHLKSVNITQPHFPNTLITGPENGTDADVATWQGGAGVPGLPGGACSGATPVRNETWGAVKAIYR